VNNLHVDESLVTLDTILVKDLGADSLDLVELLMEIEDHFGIKISDETAEKIITIKDIVDYIDEQKNEN
jgi:acyl carrier protein